MAEFSYMDAYGATTSPETGNVKTCRKPVIAAVAGFAPWRWKRTCNDVRLDLRCRYREIRTTRSQARRSCPAPVEPSACRGSGQAKAMDMCLTARMMDATEAERAGLVARVIPADKLLEDHRRRRDDRQSFPAGGDDDQESINRAFEGSLQEGLLFERRVFPGLCARGPEGRDGCLLLPSESRVQEPLGRRPPALRCAGDAAAQERSPSPSANHWKPGKNTAHSNQLLQKDFF